MDLNEYQKGALRTAIRFPSLEQELVRGALGVCDESGEFGELIKKWLFHGHELSSPALVNELGDILWYIAVAADALGYDLDTLATQNLAKLATRYPTTAFTEHSLDRSSELKGIGGQPRRIGGCEGKGGEEQG